MMVMISCLFQFIHFCSKNNTPHSENGPVPVFEHHGVNQPSSTSSSRDAPFIINESNYGDRHAGLPNAYSPSRAQRYDLDPFYPEHQYSRSYYPDRSRRRYDYNDSSEDGRR